MSDDLQFAALHSDDALLDALGARTLGAALGIAEGVDQNLSGDVVARLLGAYATEIDTRPGPLTGLLRPGVAASRPDRALAAVSADAPTQIGHRRRPDSRQHRLVGPRAAAVTTVGALVLGLSGVAAAVTGGGPFSDLRRVVSSVTGSSDAEPTPAERALKLLVSAEAAMNDGHLKLAADRLAQVEALLPLVNDPDIARTLSADLDALRLRWQAIATPAGATVARPGSKSSPGGAPTSQVPGVAGPNGITPAGPSAFPEPLVPGTGVADPTQDLSAVNNSGIGSTKDQLKNKAKQKLGHPIPSQAPLPDQAPLGRTLPAPAGGMRGPMSNDLARQIAAWELLYNFGGDALAQPDPVDAMTRGPSRAGSH